MTAPADPLASTTLIELLARRASNDPDRVAFTFAGEGHTYLRLWTAIRAFASTLVERGVRAGDRVVLPLPNGPDFFVAFYATLAVRGIAVPTYPGVRPARVVELAELCGARHVVVPSGRSARREQRWRRDAGPIAVLTTTDAAGPPGDLPQPEPDDIAFIQYTSGSTGDPKGVMLSHANLLTNIRQMRAHWDLSSADRFVSWLPLHHDLGLIVMSMAPFYLGAELFLLPTSVRDTRPWLETITRHRGTFTAAPDFGYRMCLRQLAAQAADFDLRSLRVALNGAEPVRASTIDAFHSTFGLERVMLPGYGLAEATVAVCTPKPGSEHHEDGRGAVSVGRPLPGVSVTIVDDHDAPLPAGEPGHILVTNSATTRGYFRNPAATQELFAGPDTIRTGDVGLVDEHGRHFILSRTKDVIIHAGRSVYPMEIEEAAEAVAGVGASAAIGIDRGRIEGEQVTVIAEIQPHELPHAEDRKAAVIAIVRGVHERFGFRPAQVHLAQPGTIPVTHNGKVQRGVLRRRYLDGSLAGSLVYP